MSLGLLQNDLTQFAPDHRALAANAAEGGTLCTVIAIHGSYSRRVGAQLAILPDGTFVGDLADQCLDAELEQQAARLPKPAIIRLGGGVAPFDFRLPCGSTLDILIDPSPDPAMSRSVLDRLAQRRVAALPLPAIAPDGTRAYIPAARIVLVGDNPECDALALLCAPYGAQVVHLRPRGLSMELPSDMLDAYTAVLCLSHEHEWERRVLPWALRSPSFLIGAIGGARARKARQTMLAQEGFGKADIVRVEGPIGVNAGARNPQALSFSVMAQIVERYEALLEPFDQVPSA
ncbi:MAG: XdhC family protein [Pontixanthobacter sp.]